MPNKKTKKPSVTSCPHNVGATDKKVRIILGAIVLIFALDNNNLMIAILGGLLLYTGITQNCWIYRLLGMKTCTKGDCSC